MEVVFGLVGVTLVLVVLIAGVLLWAVRSGQFEDLEGPAWRVVLDEDRPPQQRPPQQHEAQEQGTPEEPPAKQLDPDQAGPDTRP